MNHGNPRQGSGLASRQESIGQRLHNAQSKDFQFILPPACKR
jgi:hypothetical protein